MNVVDILVTIVVVTILVTIVLAVITYVAYKLRMARRPSESDEDTSPLRYFVRYEAPSGPATDARGGGEGEVEGAVNDAGDPDRSQDGS